MVAFGGIARYRGAHDKVSNRAGVFRWQAEKVVEPNTRCPAAKALQPAPSAGHRPPNPPRSRCELRRSCVGGIAPVLKPSGQVSITHHRYARPLFLHQSFIEYANESIRHSLWARAFYQMHKSAQKSHWVIIRALAYKWIRILFRCWHERTPLRRTPLPQITAKTPLPLAPIPCSSHHPGCRITSHNLLTDNLRCLVRPLGHTRCPPRSCICWTVARNCSGSRMNLHG